MVRTSNTEMKSFLEDLREDVTQIRIQSAKTEEHLKNMNGKLIYVNDYVAPTTNNDLEPKATDLPF